jgi:hypothetical protein
MNKIGEQSWQSAKSGSGSDGAQKDNFLRLSPGSNVVRILTLPHEYYQHKLVVEGGKRWGYRIGCGSPENNIDCAVCQRGDKPKRRWFLGVIDRKTGQYKVLDIGWSVYSNILTYVNDPDWGDCSAYDVDIIVNPHSGPQDYYKTAPKPKKPLSEEDLRLKAENPTENLNKRCQPWTAERIQAELNKIDNDVESDLATRGTAVSDDPFDSSDNPFTDFQPKSAGKR